MQKMKTEAMLPATFMFTGLEGFCYIKKTAAFSVEIDLKIKQKNPRWDIKVSTRLFYSKKVAKMTRFTES